MDGVRAVSAHQHPTVVPNGHEQNDEPDCEHDELVDVSAGQRPDNYLEDGRLPVVATCLECGSRLGFRLEVADVEVLD